MIPVKKAVASAIAFASDLLNAQGITLEEVELSPDRQTWLITLGLVRMDSNEIEQVLTALQGRGKREYKIFEVDADSGQTLSMKIREPLKAI